MSELDEGGKLLQHVGLVAIDESFADQKLLVTSQFHPKLAHGPVDASAVVVGHGGSQAVAALMMEGVV